MTPDRAANARLCVWLGIAPLATYEGPHGKSHDRQYEYPALDTREGNGFWLLWDALKAKGWLVSVQTRTTGQCCALIFGPSQEHFADTEEAALFTAAVALMEREGRCA